MKNEIISPLNDFVFAQIFGTQQNIGNTKAFLKTLLDIPEDEYGQLTVKNPILKRFFRWDKTVIVDLRLTTKSGKIIHIELQIEKKSNLRNRVLYYTARLLANQLRMGDDYKKLHQVISIVICNHVLLKEEKSYVNVYELRNRENHRFTDLLKVIILELPKLPEQKDSDVWPWLQFFKCKQKEEYEMLARKYPELEKAVYCAEKMSLIERWRDIQFHKNLWKADERAGLEQARIDGLAEGKLEGKLEIAHKMKMLGDSPERIQAITGLSPEDIARL